jgi:hypothetical protein
LTQSSDELTSASNQIVKDLRSHSGDPLFPTEDPRNYPASKAVLAQAMPFSKNDACTRNSWEL